MIEREFSESPYDFILEEALLTGPGYSAYQSGGQAVLDVKNIITDIDIFEHMEKPYLTGNVIIIDDNDLYNIIRFQGIETLQLTFRLAEDEFESVTKKFYMDNIIQNVRANDYQATISFHIIEDIGYISNFINVNKPYRGKGHEIVEDIIFDNFSKELRKEPISGSSSIEQDGDENPEMLFCVPNWTPLTAAEWVKRRCTYNNGAPFYLYSSLMSENLFFSNLIEIVNSRAENTRPFIYSQSFTHQNAPTVETQSYVIENYRNEKAFDLTDISFNKSAMNTVYTFHDVNQNFAYNPGTTLDQVGRGTGLRRWTAEAMFKDFSNNYSLFKSTYPEKAELPSSLSENADYELLKDRVENTHIPYVYSTQPYGRRYQSVKEGRNTREHETKITAHALRNWVGRFPITISIPGRFFLDTRRESERTVGAKYYFQFITIPAGQVEPEEDERLSGDYIIYSARHSFTRTDGYRVFLTGFKLEDEVLNNSEALEENVA